MRFLRQLRQLARRVSRISTVSCNFFIYSIFDFLYQSVSLPLVIPTKDCCSRDALRQSLSDEVLGFKLVRKEREENLLLVKGFYRWNRGFFGAFDELVGLRHVKDQFVADEFSGGVVRIGAE